MASRKINEHVLRAAETEPWLKSAVMQIKRMPEASYEIRLRAQEDLCFYARLVNPGYMYGSVHDEVFRWMQEYTIFGKGQGSSNKLIMLPRAHLKSHMVATWVSWMIMRHPDITILYLSATSELAETQLYDIQNILSSKKFMAYFPEYINPQKGNREKWNTKKLIIDHPARKYEGVRDATIATAGLTTNTTGWHADIIVADDLVVPENAYTEDGRESVKKKTSQFTSIRNTGGFTMACGTRYHPNDIYATWKAQRYEIYNEEGEIDSYRPVWEVREHAVEENGIYIWPRVVREDGKAFGFNNQELARIRAEYEDRVQFFAQYYNDPNDPGSQRITRDKFQYFNQKYLRRDSGYWAYNGNKLNIYAAVDFAFSLSKEADFTSIVVIGIDSDRNIYVLDIDRFKTDKIADYFRHIRDLHAKWSFKKLNAEITVAQKVIVNGIKDYVKADGLRLSVEEYRPSRQEGAKDERIAAALEPKYDNMEMWHYEGGFIHILEEELVSARPAHDDIKDALASAVSIATPPARSSISRIKDFLDPDKPKSRFGGVNFR